MAEPAVPSPGIDFRSRLIIDRYSSVLSRLPLRRQASLANPASADAETWNVFRTLAQLDPARWIPELMRLGRLRSVPAPRDLDGGVALTLWKKVRPPEERLRWLRRQAMKGQVRPVVGRKRKGRVIPLSDLLSELKERARERMPLEEPVEVDVIVKCPHRVLFLEIPSSDESPEEPAASDVTRTFLLRLVDAGLAYSRARASSRRQEIGFSLLILARDPQTEKIWEAAIRGLTRSEARLRRSFPHRHGFDPAVLLGNVGISSWASLRRVLSTLRSKSRDDFEVSLLDRLTRSDRPSASAAPR
jgi:hypothetical protein